MPRTQDSYNDDVIRALADLSGAVGAGFQKVYGEFAEVGDHLSKVDREFLKMDSRFENVDHELQEIRGQLDRIETMILKDHERRLEAVEKKIGLPRG